VVAALKSRRKCVGVESDPAHTKLAIARARAAVASAAEMLPF
jgi:hypothetical protein